MDDLMLGWEISDMRQNSDVEQWVRRPVTIDIRPNLDHLADFLVKDESILDVGCGAGYLKDYLKWKNYIGVDICPDEIERALKLHPGEACFKIGNLFDLEEKADVVICSRVLIHIPFEEAVAKLIQLATRLLIVILKIGPVDKLERFHSQLGSFYQMEFSRDTVNRVFGKCVVATFSKYSNIYKWNAS